MHHRERPATDCVVGVRRSTSLRWALPPGSLLKSVHGEEIATVVAERLVEFQGAQMPLTRATRILLGLEYDVAPTPIGRMKAGSLTTFTTRPISVRTHRPGRVRSIESISAWMTNHPNTEGGRKHRALSLLRPYRLNRRKAAGGIGYALLTYESDHAEIGQVKTMFVDGVRSRGIVVDRRQFQLSVTPMKPRPEPPDMPPPPTCTRILAVPPSRCHRRHPCHRTPHHPPRPPLPPPRSVIGSTGTFQNISGWFRVSRPMQRLTSFKVGVSGHESPRISATQAPGGLGCGTTRGPLGGSQRVECEKWEMAAR